MNNIKSRLIVMNFLQFAVWGAYLTCVGQFLGKVGLGAYISWFYIAQGVVSIFMPAIMGIIADKYIQPQRLLGLSHLLAGGFTFESKDGAFVEQGKEPITACVECSPSCHQA